MMTRKLDAAIAEALGREVTWQRKVRTGGKRVKSTYVYYACSPDDKFAQLFYAGTEAEVPKFHKDGNAMLQLDAEMRARGWSVEIVRVAGTYSVYIFRYSAIRDPDINKGFKAISEKLPDAFAKATGFALTGKDWC